MDDDGFDVEEARALAQAIIGLNQLAGRAMPFTGGPLADRVRDHLDLDPDDPLPNTSVGFPMLERANLQLALNAIEATGRPWEIIGLSAELGHYGDASLTALLGSTWHAPGETGRRYESVATSATEQLDCLKAGIVLTTHDDEPVALLTFARTQTMQPELFVEVGAASQAIAEGFLAHVRHLMDEHNVLRGKVVTFEYGRHGDFGLGFLALPEVAREQVILPESTLTAVEEHTLGISEHRAELVAAGQHVKRGLLLYGPPGTGKTHTVTYLLTNMPDRTSIVLSGASVGAIGQAGSIARSLQPATIVIEDVDLIGSDRTINGGDHNSLLFQLLNEMDGLADDADVVFILTTNRDDLLEPALAERPGRVDQAVEIGLPDATARRRLLQLYVGGSVDEDTSVRVIDGTAGVTAAFVKELARRATLARLRDGGTTGDHLEAALSDLRDHAAPVLRRTLGGGPDDPRSGSGSVVGDPPGDSPQDGLGGRSGSGNVVRDPPGDSPHDGLGGR